MGMNEPFNTVQQTMGMNEPFNTVQHTMGMNEPFNYFSPRTCTIELKKFNVKRSLLKNKFHLHSKTQEGIL